MLENQTVELKAMAPIESFQVLLYNLANSLSAMGYEIKPFRHESLPLFHALSPTQQREVHKYLKAYCLALEDGQFDKEACNATRLVWRFLVALGFFPNEELFDTLREENFVQIYNHDHFQIFRSLSFFERCSLTLEEIMCRPWYQVWKRSRRDLYILSEVSRQNTLSPGSATLRFKLPYSRGQEIANSAAVEFTYRIKSATALTRSGRLQATLLVEDWKF